MVSFVDGDVCGRWSGMGVGLELFGPVLDEMMSGTYRIAAREPVRQGV